MKSTGLSLADFDLVNLEFSCEDTMIYRYRGPVCLPGHSFLEMKIAAKTKKYFEFVSCVEYALI